MPSKKQMLIEQVRVASPNSDEKTLNRMTIHSLNTLLATLNGNVQEPVKEIDGLKKEKMTRKFRSKKRLAKAELEQPIENEVIEENCIENEVIEESVVEPVIEPVVEPIIAEPKKRRGRPKKNEQQEKEIGLDISPQPVYKSNKMTDDKAHVKEILDDFKKEISKLIAQYRKIRNKTDDHTEKLISIYNDIYDDTVKMCEDQINKSYFPDETIYDYVDKQLITQKNRIQKILQ